MLILTLVIIFLIMPSQVKAQDERYKTQKEKEELRRVIREEAKRGNRWR